MYLSQTNASLFDYYGTVEETVRHLSECGFQYMDVSFFACFSAGSIYFSDEYMKVVEAYRHAFEKYGMKPAQSHAPASNSLGDDGGAYFMKKTTRAIEMAAKIGCPSITIHPGCRSIPTGRDRFIEDNIAVLKKLIPYAEQYGIKLLYENIGRREIEHFYSITAEDVIDVVDSVDSPYLGVCWDVGHANMHDLDQYAEITKLGKRIDGLHIHDNFGTRTIEDNGKVIFGDVHTVPLFCNLDFDPVMRALIDIGYKGAFNFEVTSGKANEFIKDQKDLLPYARNCRLATDKLLYDVGTLILNKYNCFEG